jgi:formate dehydrogenase subunit delta
MQINKLVRMANQIAANFDYGPDKDKAVAGVVDHLRRFWTPDMRSAIIDYAKSDAAQLTPVAARAVAELEQQRTQAA